MASQGAANALGMQQGIDFTGALINGSLGMATKKLEELAINEGFSITNAALTMEQNALSQGLNITLRKHQHFDWEVLGISGVTGGILGNGMSILLKMPLLRSKSWHLCMRKLL